jgi:flagellin-like hook-associated protein FlgL
MRSNLYSITNTSNTINQNQQRLSTGKKVNAPTDNPTNFFAAQSLLARANDLSTSKDSMNNTIQTSNLADTGFQGVSSILQSAQGVAAAAQSTSNPQEQASYASSYQTLISQAGQMANDSGLGSSVTSVLPSGTLNATSSKELESAVSSLRMQSSALSSRLGSTATIQKFTDSMINNLQTGASNLTLGDMNQEGANALMLQTRQQLGNASMRLSSQSAQSVLKLF